MPALAHLLRRLPSIAGMIALTALLSACVLSSVEPLVTDAEATTPFPANPVLHGYKTGDAGYTPTDETPVPLTLDGKSYVSADAEARFRLVPLAGGADMYLLAATGDDSTIYGVLRYAAGVFEMQIILDHVEDAVSTSGLPGLVIEDGGIVVATRADLDVMVNLIRSGKIKADPVVYYVADGPNAPVPALLVRQNGVLKPAD